MPRFTLTKNERLCGDKAISRLFDEGRRGFAFPFRYFWRVENAAADAGMQPGEDRQTAVDGQTGSPEEAGGKQPVSHRCADLGVDPCAEPCAAVFFSVPKKLVKRAVKRNYIRRRMREAYRLNKYIVIDKAVAAGKRVEIAMIYSAKEAPDFKTIENGIKRILAEVGKGL